MDGWPCYGCVPDASVLTGCVEGCWPQCAAEAVQSLLHTVCEATSPVTTDSVHTQLLLVFHAVAMTLKAAPASCQLEWAMARGDVGTVVSTMARASAATCIRGSQLAHSRLCIQHVGTEHRHLICAQANDSCCDRITPSCSSSYHTSLPCILFARCTELSYTHPHCQVLCWPTVTRRAAALLARRACLLLGPSVPSAGHPCLSCTATLHHARGRSTYRLPSHHRLPPLRCRRTLALQPQARVLPQLVHPVSFSS